MSSSSLLSPYGAPHLAPQSPYSGFSTINLHPLQSIAIVSSPSSSGFQLSPSSLTINGRRSHSQKLSSNAPSSQIAHAPAPRPKPSSRLTISVPDSWPQRSIAVHSSRHASGFPYEYQLPHFHPPRYSRRLRALISERNKPAPLDLNPPRRQPPSVPAKNDVETPFSVSCLDLSDDEESAGLLDRPRRRRRPAVVAHTVADDPRVLLFVIVLLTLMAVAGVAAAWGILAVGI